MKDFLIKNNLCGWAVRSLIILGAMVFTFEALASSIEKIEKINQIKSKIKEADSNTLVIWDIDNVIMMPQDAYTLSRNKHRKELWQELQNELSDEQIKHLYSIITINAKWQLVEPEVLLLMADLEKRNIPTVALSTFGTGKYGIIDKREMIRLRDLKSVHIDFTPTSPFAVDAEFPELASEHGIPMIKNGVIFTTELDKAQVLGKVLQHFAYRPREIIFIDDQLKNLESVSLLCQSLGIKFHGFHYVAVSLLPPIPSTKEAEEKRFKILQQNHQWLTN